MNSPYQSKGCLIISLDFEMRWGAWPGEGEDVLYIKSILGARTAIPKILDLFSKYDIHATWATVGLLFFDTREQMLAGLPEIKPQYDNQLLYPYNRIGVVGKNEQEDSLNYGASLVRFIRQYPNQEIGSHTFSHYYCLEHGQTIESFESDIKAALAAADLMGIKIKSIVFPRNQANQLYLAVCKELGIHSYRGNPKHWLYKDIGIERWPIKKAFRMFDAYINISGHHCCYPKISDQNLPCNLQWSRYLRPFSSQLRFLEPLKIKRIKNDLTHAAKTGAVYHLWWHPYNFGLNIDENINNLKQILKHHAQLKQSYEMESLNMSEICARIEKNYE